MFSRKKKKEPSRLDDPKFREEIKSDMLPDLIDLYNTDVGMKDVLEKLPRNKFKDDEVLPFCVSAKNNYVKIGEKLAKYGADKEALKEMNLHKIMEIMKYVIEPGVGGPTGEEYQHERSEAYLGLSARFLQELGEKIGIKVDEEIRNYNNTGPRVREAAPAYEMIEEEPVDTNRLKDSSKNISDIFKYDNMHAGKISSILDTELVYVERSGAPDDLIRDYLSAASYFKDQPEDKMIPREDTSINMLRKLSNKLDIYLKEIAH